MPKIAIAGFQHETNTFSPVTTTLADFTGHGSAYGGMQDAADLTALGDGQFNSPVSGFIRRGRELGFTFAPAVSYSAEPSNAVPRDVFETLLEDILTRLQAEDCDGVFLDLHGAMVVEGFVDGETEILKRLRTALGDLPVVASLDLHANLTAESLELCSAFVACREYPHVDMYETGQRCADLMGYLLGGGVLFHHFRQMPFLLTSSRETTFEQPSKGLYGYIPVVETQPDVLSASIVQGFAGADVAHMGPSVFAYGKTPQAAEKAAAALYDAFAALESEFVSDGYSALEGVREAIRLAAELDRPVVISDKQDNPGGGSSADTTFILKELQRQGARGAVVGMLYDPSAADAAYAAGQGAQIELDLGGKYIPGDKPLHAVYTVEKLHDGEVTGTGPMAKGIRFHLGRMALLRLADILIVVGSTRMQAADQCLFAAVGVEPAQMQIVVVKSANHFRADFEPIAGRILSVVEPGSDVEDPSTFTYTHLRSGVRLKGNGPVQP